MSEAFWWYMLAGFLLGFSVSTLWEWIYFRRRRMVIRDRRIAELEATVRAYTAAANAPSDDTAADDWAEPTFQNPGVYLETEETASSPMRPDTLPPAQNPSPAPTVVAFAPIINGAHAPATQPATVSPNNATVLPNNATVLPNNYVTFVSPAPAGFQSLAVQQPPAPVSAATRTDTTDRPPAEDDSRLGEVLVALGAAAVMQHSADDSTAVAPEADRTPASDADMVTPAPVYVNGTTSKRTPEIISSSASEDGNRAITSAEIGVLVSSINDLIDTVSQEQQEGSIASGAAQPEISSAEAYSDPYVTRINGRTEYVLVRMVQSLMQFMRQLREIFGGADGTRPAIRTTATTSPDDDLTRIAGLGDEQAARLRTAGVTTYARLAELSPDELRMITLTPGGATVDPAQWQAQALQFTGALQQGGERA